MRVDYLDTDAAILYGLNAIGDVDQLARGGIGISKGRSATIFLMLPPDLPCKRRASRS
jgi:hypothetical protein